MTKTRKAARQMHVFKVTSRVKVEGERRYPYRVLGMPQDADLDALAGAIVSAFGFDLDHAYGFFDGRNPYRSAVAYELFRDLEGGGSPLSAARPGGPGDLPEELADEADLALTLALDGLSQSALLRETAAFLTRRLEEEVLPRVPGRLQDAVRERLSAFAAEALALGEEEEDVSFSVAMPPEVRAMLARPDGIEQVLATLAPARQGLGAGDDLPGLAGLDPAPGRGREEHGVRGVPVTEPFGRQEKWTFLFDYGDDWTFDVTYQGLQDAPPRVRLPHVLDSVGTAPDQYPEWDE
ncbi:hypothetical protein QOL99_08155 [Deinococcus sp. MIMF12]|uniref:Uncharacterized protein n=1 Tax=Deinococcus rhizophilus TaxID=3049544 RepID=A0ABT7JJJ9_9DEIO|nr:hypothetical protein [Deinococcus rhizophilus]MDL2344123.1 hypothetical protein [Deinococcus rhizophilus]